MTDGDDISDNMSDRKMSMDRKSSMGRRTSIDRNSTLDRKVSIDRNTEETPVPVKTRKRTFSGAKPRRRRSRLSVKVTRPAYTEHEFQKGFYHQEQSSFPIERIPGRLRQMKYRWRCSDIGKFLLNLFPIIHWLPRYNIKDSLLGDMIAGCTIGVMRIPQAMAYAILATVPAVYGLYVAFFPTLIYAVLGTSRHISIGTFAVVSIMTGNAIDNFLGRREESSTPTIGPTAETTIAPIDPDLERVQVATSICMLIGIIQLLMGILRLGFVTIYLSEPLVRGFTTGAAVHVFTSQFKSLFGIYVPRFSGPLSIVYSYKHFFTHLYQTNAATLVISIVSILFLMSASEILDYHANRGLCNSPCCSWCKRSSEEDEEEGPKEPKERKPKKKLPLPTELIVIVVATAISYKGNFETKFGVDVVGHIPTGLPAPTLPHFSYFVQLLPDAIAISIVAFAISVSMASLMGKRNNYEVNSNQELLAYGTCSIVCSFFHCFPHAASLSRSVVQESSGGKTQIAGLVSSVLVLFVLLFLGMLFTQLPVACLASVIVVALRGMFRQFKDILVLWKVSAIDLSIWILSFLAVVFLGVDLGLLVAVLYSLITVIVRTQKPQCVLMGKVPGMDIYRDIAVMKDAEEMPGIKIFRSSSSLCFVNVEHFKMALYSKVGINPQKALTMEGDNQACSCCSCSCVCGQKDEDDVFEDELPDMASSTDPSTRPTSPKIPKIPVAKDVHTIVIDCSMFSFIDVVGIKTLQNIVADYKKLGIRVVFANCKAPIRHSMMQSSKLSKDHTIDLGHMYLSIHDAVLHFCSPTSSPHVDQTVCNSPVCKSSRSCSIAYDFDPAIIALHQSLPPPPAMLIASLQEHAIRSEETHHTPVLKEVREVQVDEEKHHTPAVLKEIREDDKGDKAYVQVDKEINQTPILKEVCKDDENDKTSIEADKETHLTLAVLAEKYKDDKDKQTSVQVEMHNCNGNGIQNKDKSGANCQGNKHVVQNGNNHIGDHHDKKHIVNNHVGNSDHLVINQSNKDVLLNTKEHVNLGFEPDSSVITEDSRL